MTSLTAIALAVTTALLVGLVAVAWRYRGKPGARVFAVLQGVSALWVGATVAGLLTPPGPLRLRIWGLTTALSLLSIVPWVGFILRYTGRARWFTPRRFGVAAVPLVAGATAYAAAPAWQPLAGTVSQQTVGAGTVVVSSIGPLGSALGVYTYGVFLVGFGLVIKTVLEGSRLFVGQAFALVVGSLVTVAASVLVIADWPTAGYPLTQVALGGQALLWAYAVFGQQLLAVVPSVGEIGEKAVFDELDDAILVVDDEGVVVRTNPTARSFLDADRLTGEPVEPVLDRMGVDSLAALPTRFEQDGRTLRADASRVRNWQGETVGRAVIVRDISPVVIREQRLTVLNRVLRHNVRNDMNVVLGISQQLAGHDDDEVADCGETLDDIARGLTEVGEKAVEINRMFDSVEPDRQIHLPTLIDDVVPTLAERHPEATVTTAVGVETLRSDPKILPRIVEEVVANALEHAGAAPQVEVAVEGTDDGARIVVTDDGPGIPESEIGPIAAREETQLHHTSGLGLWLVCWGSRALGGDLDIETTPEGSRVTVRVPDGTDGAGATGAANPGASSEAG